MHNSTNRWETGVHHPRAGPIKPGQRLICPDSTRVDSTWEPPNQRPRREQTLSPGQLLGLSLNVSNHWKKIFATKNFHFVLIGLCHAMQSLLHPTSKEMIAQNKVRHLPNIRGTTTKGYVL